MKKALISIILILTITLIGCGCNDINNEYDENYNYITDCQLAKAALLQPFAKCNVTKCETGYYALASKILYYIEGSTMRTTPLCNKPNCMHNNESCNAYVGVVDDIFYSDGYIYYMESAGVDHEFEGSSFVKMSADGSQKEEVLYTEYSPDDWIVHKGRIYYCVKKYLVDDNTGLDDINYADCYIYSYPTDKSSDVKEIYFAEEVEKDAQISSLTAYGDNLYFHLYGMKRYNDKIEVVKSLKLNLSDSTVTETVSPSGEQISGPMYLDGMLIFSSGEEEDGKHLYYKTDFDGNNPEKFISTYDGENIICDGKYLYVDNYFALNLSKYIENDEPVNKEERYIKVYDSGLNKVDEFSLGSDSAKTWCILPIDDKVFMFCGKSDDEEIIFYYDKTELGSLNGKVWDKKFAYRSKENYLSDNNNKIGAISDVVPNGSDALIDLWQKAKDKGYGVKDTFQSDGAEVDGGFSIKLSWNQDNGTVNSYFPFLEFASEDKAIDFMADYPYSICSKNILVLVGVKSVPEEVHTMLVSILNGEPINPIDSKDFSGNNYYFS